MSQGTISTLQTSDILSSIKEQPQAKAGSGQNSCGVEDVLQLLRILYIVASDPYAIRTSQEGKQSTPCFTFKRFPKGNVQWMFLLIISEGDEQLQFNFPPDEFTSKKITTKILQQIEVTYMSLFEIMFHVFCLYASVDGLKLLAVLGTCKNYCASLLAVFCFYVQVHVCGYTYI